MQILGSLYWSVSSNINSSAFMGFSGRVRTGGLPDTKLVGRSGLSDGSEGAVAALSLMLSGVFWSSYRRQCLRITEGLGCSVSPLVKTPVTPSALPSFSNHVTY